MRNGDRNTTFFHRCASQHCRSNTIKSLQREYGGSVSNHDQMLSTATGYFEDLFKSTRGLQDTSHVLARVEQFITEDVKAVWMLRLLRLRFMRR